jgi:ABC-2 type transport system permease protein
MSAAQATAARPRTASSLVALYRLLLRTQVSVPRLLGVGALAALAVLLGVLARWDDNPAQAAAEAVAAYGLGVVVPLAALWFGASAIGDLIEDRLLVYLWLKPVPRWQLPAGAVLATITLVVPLTAVALWALLASSLAVCAYAGLFVAAGVWFRRGVWWGLAFVLIWENAVAYGAEGAARFTVTSWARSLLSAAPDVEVPLDGRPAAAALVVLPAVAVAGWLVAIIGYRRADVD